MQSRIIFFVDYILYQTICHVTTNYSNEWKVLESAVLFCLRIVVEKRYEVAEKRNTTVFE